MGYVEDRETIAIPFEIGDDPRAQFQQADDILKVASFICWQEKGDMWGAVMRNEAFEAFCRLMEIKDPARVYSIVRSGETYD